MNRQEQLLDAHTTLRRMKTQALRQKKKIRHEAARAPLRALRSLRLLPSSPSKLLTGMHLFYRGRFYRRSCILTLVHVHNTSAANSCPGSTTTVCASSTLLDIALNKAVFLFKTSRSRNGNTNIKVAIEKKDQKNNEIGADETPDLPGQHA